MSFCSGLQTHLGTPGDSLIAVATKFETLANRLQLERRRYERPILLPIGGRRPALQQKTKS